MKINYNFKIIIFKNQIFLFKSLYGATAVVTKYYCFGIWCFNEINFLIYLKFLINNK